MANFKRGASTSTDPDDLDQNRAAGETIFVVSRRTGLPMATLRAWERRYGFPRPERKSGSNRRLYTDVDIARLVSIKRALDNGYRVGDVVGKSLEALEALLEGAVRGDVLPFASTREASTDELLSMLARDDLEAFEDHLRRAGANLGPRRFVTEIAHPLAVLVGTAWESGRISIRHEHVATESLLTRLRALVADHQDHQGAPRVLLATLPGEPHGLALHMVALYLASAGAKVRILGVETPIEEIFDASRALATDIVGLTLTPVLDATTARRSVVVLRGWLDPVMPLWLGGSGAVLIGPVEGFVRIASTWDAVDEALAEWRRQDRLARSVTRDRR